MKFLRRPDLDTVTRVHIAAQAFLSLGVYGEITRIAHAYRVSRLFVYKLVWQLRLLYDLAEADLRTPEAMRLEVDRHILLPRLEGHCALERMSHILQQLGLPFAWSCASKLRINPPDFRSPLWRAWLRRSVACPTGCQPLRLLCFPVSERTSPAFPAPPPSFQCLTPAVPVARAARERAALHAGSRHDPSGLPHASVAPHRGRW